ncbi:Protein unc-13 homolog [Linum perenne]
MEDENAVELLQRYRRDRRILMDFILSGSLIKKVVMPPGAVTLDDMDLDQVSVDYVLNRAKKGGMLELSEAIREYHDSTSMPQMNSTSSADEFFSVTDPVFSGSPPRRAPPPIPVSAPVSMAAAAAPASLMMTSVKLQMKSSWLVLGAFGGLIVPSKEKKKDKKSRLMRKLGRSKTQSLASQYDRAPGMVGLLETMRAQMELFMLEEGLINHPVVGFGESGRKGSELRILLAKIEESVFRESSAGEVQRTDCLRSLRDIAIQLAERPARGDLTGEVCHWADGYHLNVKLYEKLLLSMFDILDEGKLTEEVEEILELFKSTWRVLGITETIHYTCYTWVLFRQFVITREMGVLHHAIEQLNRIPLREQRGPQERLHLKSLSSRVDGEELSFLQSFLSPIQKWADNRLGDYHLHFSEDPATMEGILQVAIVTRRLLVEESETVSKTFLQFICVSQSKGHFLSLPWIEIRLNLFVLCFALDRQVVKSESATIKLGFSDNCIQSD